MGRLSYFLGIFIYLGTFSVSLSQNVILHGNAPSYANSEIVINRYTDLLVVLGREDVVGAPVGHEAQQEVEVGGAGPGGVAPASLHLPPRDPGDHLGSGRQEGVVTTGVERDEDVVVLGLGLRARTTRAHAGPAQRGPERRLRRLSASH